MENDAWAQGPLERILTIDDHILHLNQVTQESLADTLDKGLISLYQDCFKDYPYFEKFSETDVRSIFQAYLELNAYILVITETSGTPVAFVVMHALEKDRELTGLIQDYSNPSLTTYFAEAGVDTRFRRKGLSRILDKTRFDIARESGFNRVLIRTNINNYKKIASIINRGGKVIAGLKEKVLQKRLGDQVLRDERIFFTVELQTQIVEPLFLNRVVIARPGGNDTAIVFDPIARSDHKKFNALIQRCYPGVEQVMFVEVDESGNLHGQMAGGEFCGNATRSLGYLLLGRKNGRILLNVSGASAPLEVEVFKGSAKAAMPVYVNHSSVQRINKGLYMVSMEGITHLVAENHSAVFREFEELDSLKLEKQFTLEVLERYGIIHGPASGLMFLDQSRDPIQLRPYVYVRDIQTLYPETACGSGTTAVGLVLSKRSGQSISRLPVRQPSGLDIEVTVENDGRAFRSAAISGDVIVIFDGRMPLEA